MPNESSSSRPKAAADVPAEHADIEVEIDIDLIERRKSIRPIPAPEAIEHNDEESWSTWNELMDRQVEETALASALAKLRQLLNRKRHGGDVP